MEERPPTAEIGLTAPMWRWTKRLFKLFGRMVVLYLLVYSAFYVVQAIRRPSRSNLTEQLYQGITYQRIARKEPRYMMIHVFEIDYSAEGIAFFVTPPDRDGLKQNMDARRTSDFAEEFSAEIAINGSFFYPFERGNIFNGTPDPGEPLTVDGLAIADGRQYASSRSDFKAICFLPERVSISLDGSCPANTSDALAGPSAFLRDGQPYFEPDADVFEQLPYGRAAVGIDESGTRVWLIGVDNKQWFYSRGIGMRELAEVLQELGATQAVTIDGGGSVTLVSGHSGRHQVLNSPLSSGTLGRERPVANHIGVHALPLAIDK